MNDIDPTRKTLTDTAKGNDLESKSAEKINTEAKVGSSKRKITIKKGLQDVLSRAQSLFDLSNKGSYDITNTAVTKEDGTELINFLTATTSISNNPSLEEARSTLNPHLLECYKNGIKAKTSAALADEMKKFILYLKDNYLHNQQNILNQDQKKVLYNMFVDMSARVDILKDSVIKKATTKKAKAQAYQNILDQIVDIKLNLGIKTAITIGPQFYRVVNMYALLTTKNKKEINDTFEQCLGLYSKNLDSIIYNEMQKTLKKSEKELDLETKKDNPDQSKIEKLKKLINMAIKDIEKHESIVAKINSGELFSQESFMDDYYSKVIANILTMAQKENITLNLEKIPLKRL